MFSLLSSPLFWEEHFGYIKTIAKAFDDQYFYIIEDESCEEHADAALQLRIPTDISWEEMSDGGFVSDVAFNMFHNNYLVYGENGYWGRWCDYENGTIDYEVFGYKKMNPAIQHYKEWCSADIDMNEAEMIRLPKEIRQYLVLK